MKYEDIHFPNKFDNKFRLRIYYELENSDLEYVIMIYLNKLDNNIPVRIHSACLTGDIFRSKKCDCYQQLIYSLNYITKKQKGILFYLPQEGRGIGIINKIKAYKLQNQGFDTFKANEKLDLPIDNRKYKDCEVILKNLNINNIELLTNNPFKIKALKDIKIQIHRIAIEPNKYNKKYINDKLNFFNPLKI